MSNSITHKSIRKTPMPRTGRALDAAGSGYRSGGGNAAGGGANTENPADNGISKNIRVNSPKVGHIDTGKILSKGSTYEQIFRQIFYKPEPATLIGKISTPNDVEIGSTKGVLSYTATRNDHGVLFKAYFDGKVENVLKFTDEVNGVQTATRQLTGTYTASETYIADVIYSASEGGDLPQITLNSRITVNARRKWFAGVCSAIPANSAQVRALGSNGLYNGIGSYKFTISGYQTFVICIPGNTIKEVTLERYVYNFMDLDSAANPKKINVEGANGSTPSEYTMYVFRSVTVSPETDNFTFKTV